MIAMSPSAGRDVDSAAVSAYREPPHVHRWRLLPGLAWRCDCGTVRLVLWG